MSNLLTRPKTSWLTDTRNQLKGNPQKVSAIFDFYPKDFTGWSGKSMVDYINTYAATKLKLAPGEKLQYLNYDWSLNEQGKKFQD